VADGQLEGERERERDDARNKGGMKKVIITMVPLIVIALVVVWMTELKPPPATSAQGRAKVASAERALETKCAAANGLDAAATTTAGDVAGPVLDLDPKTMNLDGTHFLKVGMSLQLPAGSVPEEVKVKENWGSIASQLVIDTFTGRSFRELSKDALREQLQREIGNEICKKTAGKVVTVYVTDFVMQ
jgi:flagellar basal body-associated protein FliL